MNIFDIDNTLRKRGSKNLQGFSLGELLVVIMIVVLLALTILFAYRRQIDKANDATRKEHLKKYRIAFEDYYNDHNCYPSNEATPDDPDDAEWVNCTCGSACFTPYMESFLCDPNTGQKYYYYLFNDEEGNPDPCRGYRLFTKLNNSGDTDINNAGCSWTRGCGDDTRSAYNYGIAMGGPLTDETFNPIPTSTPTPTQAPMGNIFCLGDGSGNCNVQSGCAKGYDGRLCSDVLINDFGCQGFFLSENADCEDQCRNNYNETTCLATETIICSSDCQ